MRDVQTHRVDRDPRQRHGAPGCVRSRRLRSGTLHRLGVRHGHRARRPAEMGRRGYPPVLRKRSALPGAVPAVRLVYNWLRELVPVSVDVETAAREISLRGFEVASVEHGREPVIDFEITANRPDCLNHLGLAREASAIWGLELNPGSVVRDAGSERSADSSASRIPDPGPRTTAESLDVVIEASDLCPRYCARVFSVQVGPSPDWLRARLEAAGVRPINNVVDVTNYV